MIINFNNRTIELTKAEANKARVYGSDSYTALQNARKDNEGYTVVVLTTKKNSSKNSKITYEDMKRYISFHDDEDGTIMKEFKENSKKKKDGELYGYNFFALKKWFFEKYPELSNKNDNENIEINNENKKGA